MSASLCASAMSFERAQAEALYLTDKMAYELNLNDQQYNDAYEINLDYFLRMDSPSDLYGVYYRHRLDDLRCILYDWQYGLLMAADYFLRPIVWRSGGWFFPIYSHYRHGHFYYARPHVWVSYRGGHSRHFHHAGFYANRRPVWNGGLRGRDRIHHSAPPRGGRNEGIHHSGRDNRPGREGHRGGVNAPGRGDNRDKGNLRGGSGQSGKPYSFSDSGSARPPRGNSFDGSSSRVNRGNAMGGNPRSAAPMGGSRVDSRVSSHRSSAPSMQSSRGGGGMSRSGAPSRGSGSSSRGGRR